MAEKQWLLFCFSFIGQAPCAYTVIDNRSILHKQGHNSGNKWEEENMIEQLAVWKTKIEAKGMAIIILMLLTVLLGHITK